MSISDFISHSTSYCRVNNNFQLVKFKGYTDSIGMTHEKYKQSYNGIPIEL
jgi:Zn-dependent metalloprotease